jgi:hypothetical protein
MCSSREPALAVLLGLLGLLGGLLALQAARLLPPLEAAAPPTGAHGRVTSAGGPLAGARVRIQGTEVFALTDAAGHFRLPAHPGTGRVTAWKEGYRIAGARRSPDALTLRLTPLPRKDHPAYAWVDPGPRPGGEHNCANCHAEIYREWRASGHARSAAGKHFRNLYEGTDWAGRPGAGWGLLPQRPDAAGVCTSCHAPTVRDGDPALFDLRKVRGVDALGAHCDLCHKIVDVKDNVSGLTHGRFNLRLLRPEAGQLFFGPLDDVDRGEDAYSPLYRDSRYCAACHEGVVLGTHVYSTYSEWRAGPAARAGRHCQHCHMAPTGKMTNLAPGRGGLERPAHTLANHRFFDGSHERMLRGCLKLSASFERRRAGVSARLRLEVEGVGHRVPTGYIDRHLLLVVEGLGPDGKPLRPGKGPTLPAPAGPELAGRPGRLFGRLLADADGHSPAPFWRADSDPTDTRLTPGRAEKLTFEFPPALARLRVRVLYRRFWQEVARAKRWPDRDLVVLERTFDAR